MSFRGREITGMFQHCYTVYQACHTHIDDRAIASQVITPELLLLLKQQIILMQHEELWALENEWKIFFFFIFSISEFFWESVLYCLVHRLVLCQMLEYSIFPYRK